MYSQHTHDGDPRWQNFNHRSDHGRHSNHTAGRYDGGYNASIPQHPPVYGRGDGRYTNEDYHSIGRGHSSKGPLPMTDDIYSRERPPIVDGNRSMDGYYQESYPRATGFEYDRNKAHTHESKPFRERLDSSKSTNWTSQRSISSTHAHSLSSGDRSRNFQPREDFDNRDMEWSGKRHRESSHDEYGTKAVVELKAPVGVDERPRGRRRRYGGGDDGEDDCDGGDEDAFEVEEDDDATGGGGGAKAVPSSLLGTAPDFDAARLAAGSGGDAAYAPTKETDEHRLSTRLKQIQYGKNTIGYDNYTTLVPKKKRNPYNRDHPRTPDPYAVQSKRAFDGRIRSWRRELHKWDDLEEARARMEGRVTTKAAEKTAQESAELASTLDSYFSAAGSDTAASTANITGASAASSVAEKAAVQSGRHQSQREAVIGGGEVKVKGEGDEAGDEECEPCILLDYGKASPVKKLVLSQVQAGVSLLAQRDLCSVQDDSISAAAAAAGGAELTHQHQRQQPTEVADSKGFDELNAVDDCNVDDDDEDDDDEDVL